MDESSDTSFNLTSSSGGIQGLPALGTSRESSSGASSETRRVRRNSPYPQRPPRMSREQELQDLRQVSPSTTSSPPPLEDRSGVGHTDTNMGIEEFGNSSFHQTFQDQRALNVDHRSVHIQQHVHGPDPSLVGNLAAAVASSEMRAEAESALAGVRVEAAHAVATAQMSAESVRAEAAQAVTAAHLNAESTRIGAVAEIRNLETQLEAVRNENLMIKRQLSFTLETSERTRDQDASNGAGLNLIFQRLTGIEAQLQRLESKMDTHQEYIQELWLQQPPIPQVQQEGSQTPVVRLDVGDQHGQNTFRLWDDERENQVSHEGSQASVMDIEKRCLRTKDLHHLKLPRLPESASQFRSWKNAVRTMLLSYDHSQEGLVSQWLSPAFTARDTESETLRTNSGDFPRLDRVIASVLCKQEALKTSFGLRIQSYVESCEALGSQIRGRYIINLVSKEFDTSAAAGAITSSLELFQLPTPQDSPAALKHWHDKVVYILSQLPLNQRPSEDLMSQWVYNTLKKHPLLRRVMDKYHDSPLGSPHRTFEAIWVGVEKALLESQHDVNAQSIRDDLKRGPMVGKKSALPGMKGDGKSKDKRHDSKGKTGKGQAVTGKGTGSQAPGSQQPNPKDKPGLSTKQGSPDPGKGKSKPLTPEEKAKSPCIYFMRSRCMRGDQCPYSHAVSSTQQPKPKASPGPGLVAKAAAVAILATPAAATALPSSSTRYLELVGDTGAGENLASVEALRRQGLEVDQFITQTSHPVKFLTGGGQRCGDSTVGFWSSEFQRMSNFYLLPQCPVALSIGQLVEEDGYSFLWHPSKLPMLIPPTTQFHFQVDGPTVPADRVEHHVPMFRLAVDCAHGLPALSPPDVSLGGGEADPATDDIPKEVETVEDSPLDLDWDSRDVDEWIAEELVDPAPGAGRQGEPAELVDPAPGAGRQGQADEFDILKSDQGEISEEEGGVPCHHLMTHLPKSRNCDTCKRAKLYEQPHRRAVNQNERMKEARMVEAPTFFLEKLSVDHIIVRDEIGFNGETCTFVMVDVFSGFTSMVPCQHKSAEEVEMAFRRFCGKKRPGIIQVVSDRAPEIKRALADLGFASEPAAPYQKVKNALAESTIKTIRGMTSSILLHAGLDLQYWPLAQRYLEWAFNLTSPAKGSDPKIEGNLCRYEKAMGYSIECFMVPFGALVWFKDPDPYSFGPKGEPGLFLGAELTDGMLFKGCYKVWPLEQFKNGVFKQHVSRTLAIPNGEWNFPAVVPALVPELDPVAFKELEMEDDDFYEPSIAPSIKSEPDDLDCREFWETLGEDGPAPGAGIRTEGEPKPRRNRPITPLRIAVWGKTPACDGCKEGTYAHSKDCRDRFNKLLDEAEPSRIRGKARDLEPEAPGKPAAEGDFFGLSTPVTGKELAETELEVGSEVVAAIYLRELDQGTGTEEELAAKLSAVMHTCVQPPERKPKSAKKWFVEFCCSENSACCRISESCSIPYLGLSENFGDLRDPAVIDQVMFWFQETTAKGEVIDLYGSIPCAPYSPLQNLNLAVQGHEYERILAEKRVDTETLVDHFCQLSEVALESGGSSSFEWPLCNSGWKQDQIIQMIVHFNMYSCYPLGCGMGLEIDGKHPLKEWRIVTTSKRLAAHLDKFRCTHPQGFKHDPIEGGTMAKKSGVYNTKMAVAILSALNPELAMREVPAMPVTHGSVAHQERGLIMAQTVLGMVHTPLTRQELFSHPQGRDKIKEEADEMRLLQVWDDEDVYEVEDLRALARQEGWKVHIAEAMPIGSIKNSESKDRAKLKVRLVFRGDDTRDEYNQLALFRELKSIPATIATVNLVLWFGLRANNIVQIADAKKAYLQAPIRSAVPTYVVLPREAWKPQWHKRFKRVAARLHKAMYGHPTSGDDWTVYLNEIVVYRLQGDQVEGWPSLWYIQSLQVLVAAYVDDIVVSGPQQSVPIFWQMLSQHITVDTIEEPGRYLGRDHLIVDFGTGRHVYMSMCDYAVSAVQLYEDQFHQKLKVYDTPFVSEAALPPQGYEEAGQLAGKAAQLLMKLLWLARLSRPDLSFAITSLASHIAKWTRNHDLMLYRLLGYVKGSVDLGILGTVSAHQSIPRLDLYADADLAGDPMTMKSHSGHFVIIQDDHGTSFPIYWGAKKQSCVSRSTTEAEIVSASVLVFDEGIPIKTVMELVLGEPVVTTLREDNSADIMILQNGYSPKLKSLNRTHKISVAALAEAVDQGLILAVQTPTKEQKGDIFTKALSRPQFLEARSQILVTSKPQKADPALRAGI